MESFARAGLAVAVPRPARVLAPARAAAPLPTAPLRLGFVDNARALAVGLMIPGHVVNALLAPEHRTGPLFHAWTFTTGLVACTFLIVGYVLHFPVDRLADFRSLDSPVPREPALP